MVFLEQVAYHLAKVVGAVAVLCKFPVNDIKVRVGPELIVE